MASDADLLAQLGRDTRRDQLAPKRKPGAPALDTGEAAGGSQDWRADRIREWLLLILRFAITRDPKDEMAALAMADEIDALGLRWRPSGPSFFRRTSAEVCQSISAPDYPRRATILRRHSARIEDPRLRRAFRAAVECEQSSPAASSEAKRRNLWAGLRLQPDAG